MLEVYHLEDRPGFAATIADRCWRAWWSDSDVTLARYQAGIEQMAVRGRVPSAFLACRGGFFAGSVLLIDDDLPERPLLAPWIAALWVEPAFRRAGVALELIDAARDHSARIGHGLCYLNATDAKSPYYEARGFRRVESDVGDVNVFSIPTVD